LNTRPAAPRAATHAHQDQILEAAAECFMERGYNASSIDDVARRLGSTKGRIYHHYPSKADLFADVFRHGMAMNFRLVEPIAESGGPSKERLKAMSFAHCLNMIRTRPFQRCVWEGVSMLMRGATTPEQRATLIELQQQREKYADIFRTVLEECREAGVARFENVGIILQIFFMSLNSPLFWYSPRDGDDEKSMRQIASQCTQFALRGVGLKEKDLTDV
jgi:AcrR family transcriptional regulator